LAATISARADLAEVFKKCCLESGKYDGSNRNYFFPRVIQNLNGPGQTPAPPPAAPLPLHLKHDPRFSPYSC
jgi:hypothetical protein